MKNIARKMMMVLLIHCCYGNLYSEIYNDPDKKLSLKQLSIIPIAAYTAKGDLQPLKSALN